MSAARIQQLVDECREIIRHYDKEIEELYFKFTVEYLQEMGFIDDNGINKPQNSATVWLRYKEAVFQYNYENQALYKNMGFGSWYRIADTEDLKRFMK